MKRAPLFLDYSIRNILRQLFLFCELLLYYLVQGTVGSILWGLDILFKSEHYRKKMISFCRKIVS